VLRLYPDGWPRVALNSKASFRAFFSEGQKRSPVSITPSGECNAITNP
jgi:hypothetical protein